VIGEKMYRLYRSWRAFLLAALFCSAFSALTFAQQADPAQTGAAPAATPAISQNPAAAPAQPSAPDPQLGYISGVVADAYGDIVQGALVILEDGTPADRRALESSDIGVFQFSGLRPGIAYRITIKGKGFDDWTSQPITLTPGQFFSVTGIKLKFPDTGASVTVYANSAQLATEQVQVEEHQRVLGFIPNYYVVYDGKNAVPMTAKLKFQMAFKTAVDPISILGSAFLAGVDQATDSPDYVEGAKGYFQRFGANYTDGFTDIMFGGAVLPALLHQDPRYYYQGTGTTGSRLKHALAYPFICKGDNGHLQPNYSTIGGDLISSSLSNLYYPKSNRGVGLTFTNFAVSTAERGLSTVLQEFVLRKLTPSARKAQ
jgi:hypothetical protein